MPVRVVLADPPAYTPFYDHDSLRHSRARARRSSCWTSRFRFGALPPPSGYVRREAFYPLSSLLPPLTPADPRQGPRAPARAGAARNRPRGRRARPVADGAAGRREVAALARSFRLHRARPLARRTVDKVTFWREDPQPVRRSRRPQRQRAEDARRPRRRREPQLCVIPLAITPTDVPRADDGRTLLFSVLRPYKGLPDALEVARRIDDVPFRSSRVTPAMPLERTSLPNVDWRLGYLGEDEVRRALGGNRRDVPVQAGARPERGARDRPRRHPSASSRTTSTASQSRSGGSGRPRRSGRRRRRARRRRTRAAGRPRRPRGGARSGPSARVAS